MELAKDWEIPRWVVEASLAELVKTAAIMRIQGSHGRHHWLCNPPTLEDYEAVVTYNNKCMKALLEHIRIKPGEKPQELLEALRESSFPDLSKSTFFTMLKRLQSAKLVCKRLLGPQPPNLPYRERTVESRISRSPKMVYFALGGKWEMYTSWIDDKARYAHIVQERVDKVENPSLRLFTGGAWKYPQPTKERKRMREVRE